MMFAWRATPEIGTLAPLNGASTALPAMVLAVCEPWPLLSSTLGSSFTVVPQGVFGGASVHCAVKTKSYAPISLALQRPASTEPGRHEPRYTPSPSGLVWT